VIGYTDSGVYLANFSMSISMSMNQVKNIEISQSLGYFLRVVTRNKNFLFKFIFQRKKLAFLNTPIQIIKYCFIRKRKILLCGSSRKIQDGKLKLLIWDLKTLINYAINRIPVFVIISNLDFRFVLSNMIQMLEVDGADVIFLLRPNDQFLFFARKNQKDIVGRFCVSPYAIKKLYHQYCIIKKIKAYSSSTKVKSLIPDAILFIEKEGYAIMQQERYDGHVPDLKWRKEDGILSLLITSLDPLVELHKNAQTGVRNDDCLLLDNHFSSLNAKLPKYFGDLKTPIEIANEWFSKRTISPVLAHGDYWIGNILFAANENEITGIIDWDRARVAGLPLCDALHLYVATVSKWKNQYFSVTLINLLKNKESLTSCYIEEIKKKFKCNEQDVFYTIIFLWLLYIWTSVEEGDMCEQWYDQMIPCVSKQISITYQVLG